MAAVSSKLKKNKNLDSRLCTLTEQDLDLMMEDEDDLITKCPFTQKRIAKAAKANVSYNYFEMFVKN